MTPPPDPRRPPSEELSWELLIRLERLASAEAQLLCRTIRSLCAERELQESIPWVRDAALAKLEVERLTAQLSAYVTAAEGRPASELIAPSGAERAMRVLAPSMPESGLEDACRQVKQAAISGAQNCEMLERKLAEQAAEISRLRARLRGDHCEQHGRDCDD